MLIPIGHEENTVRRMPWVSITIIALCFLALIAVKLGGSSEAAINAAFQRAVGYYFQHPYLELDPRLEKLIFHGGREGEAEAFQEIVEQFGQKPPEDRETREAQQAELDRLVQEAFERLDSHPFHRWGLVPAHVTAVTLVTHMFLHAGWLHLIGNMLIFYLSGPFLEDRWGRPLFAGFYLAGGVLAALAFVAANPESQVPLVGASGAVAACMGAFLVLFWRTKIRFYYWIGLLFHGTFDAPAWLMLPLWLAKEMVFADASSRMPGGGTGIAHLAHVWGFLFGAAFAGALSFFGIEQRFLRPVLERKTEQVVADNREIDEAHELFARGERDRALALLRRAVSENPANGDAVLAWWALAVECGREGEVAGPMLDLVKRELRAGHADLAADHWLELASRVPDAARDPAVAARVVEQLAQAGRVDDARSALGLVLPTVDGTTPPGLLVRMARAAVIVGGAPEILRLAADHPDVPPGDRETFRSALAERPGSVAPASAVRTEVPAAPGQSSTEDAGPEGDAGQPAVAEVWDEPRRLRVAEAVPVAVTATSVRLRTASGRERELPLEQVQAVAVAGIQPPGERGYLVLDLALDSPWGAGTDLRVVRMTSRTFDPRRLLGTDGPAVEAFRALVDIVLKGSDATPLPGPEAVAGRPFATFPDLESYAREVLGAG